MRTSTYVTIRLIPPERPDDSAGCLSSRLKWCQALTGSVGGHVLNWQRSGPRRLPPPLAALHLFAPSFLDFLPLSLCFQSAVAKTDRERWPMGCCTYGGILSHSAYLNGESRLTRKSFSQIFVLQNGLTNIFAFPCNIIFLYVQEIYFTGKCYSRWKPATYRCPDALSLSLLLYPYWAITDLYEASEPIACI